MTRRASVIALSLAACTPAPAMSERSTTTTTTTITTTTGGPATTTEAPPASAEIDLQLPASTVTLTDFNGDGHIDLLADIATATVQVLHGRGDGSFEPPRLLGDRLDGPPSSIVVGDFDGDGTHDLAALYSRVAIVRGDHDETLHFAASGPALVSVDADADGLSDLFLIGANMLTRRYGHPSGHLQFKSPLGLGGEPADLITADLDADGVPDLVAANSGTDDLSVLLGDGLGGFLPQRRLAVGHFPHHLAATDLDGDGTLDLIVYNMDGLVTLRGLGEAQFAAPHGTALPQSILPYYSRILVCERDGEAGPEVIATLSGADGIGRIVQLRADADARLSDPKFLRAGNLIGEIACADLDGDARDDFAFATYAGGQFILSLSILLTGAS